MKIKIQASQIETVEKAIAATKSDLQAMAEDFDLDPTVMATPKLVGQELEIAGEVITATIWAFINKLGIDTEVAQQVQAQLDEETKEIIEMYKEAGQ